MKKYLYLIILCLWANKIFASPSLKSITIDKSLEYGETLTLNPWHDFVSSDQVDDYCTEGGHELQAYGESINWYVDGNYCDKNVFSITRNTGSGASHPWGTSTNYPYTLATFWLKANEGQFGLHVFSITLHYLYLYEKDDGTKITEITYSTIKYNIQLPEPYVVLSNDNTILSFYFDTKKKERNGMDIGPQVSNEPWINYRENITSVIFDDSFANYEGLTSTAYWFCFCSNLSTITGIHNLNTSKVNNMSSMFQCCKKLETLDLSTFNTENVTDMSFMFMGCNKLTTLDVSNFNTQNVTNMLNMFYECYALRAIDVSKFDTQNVTKMYQMFSSCISLAALDVSKFDTKNVTDMSSMFSSCHALTALDVSKFDTKNVTDMSSMFSGCYALTSLDVSKFDTKNVTNMLRMFHECKSLTALDVSNFNTMGVTRMDEMFADCNSLTSLDVRKFDTQNVTNMYNMFADCNSLTSLDVSKFDTQNVTNMHNMFSGCHALTSLDVSKFDTQNVTDMGFMFEDCKSLTTLDVSTFDTRNVTNMEFMFDGCKALHTLSLDNLNTENVTTMEHMFYECESLTTLDISMFNTRNVTNMFRMFWGCKALKSLDLSNFNTKKVTNMSYMFYWCDSLTTIYAGPDWSTKNVTNGEYVFGCCEKIIGGRGTKYDDKHTDYTYAHIDGGIDNPGYLTEKTASNIITFVDPAVKAICVVNWDTDGDGELSEAEAAAVTLLGEVFANNYTITSFDELQYFTGLKRIDDKAFSFCSQLESIILPNNLTELGNRVFEFCSSLTSLAIPKTVTRIGDRVIEGCSSLIDIKVESGNSVYDSRNNCNALIETATNTLLCGCLNTTIPDNVEIISNYAFLECSSLTSITIPNSVKSIGEQAFFGCTGLIYLSIPQSVTAIGRCAFESCNGLTSIQVESENPVYDSRNNCNAIIETASNSLLFGCQNTIIPNNVSTIGEVAFYHCKNLTNIYIPKSVTSIGYYAFEGCSGLQTIQVENSNPVYDSRENCNALIETATNKLLYGCQNTILPTSITSIGNGAFYNCTGLTNVVIPQGVTSLGNSTFRGCSNLETIIIPGSVTAIGYSSFTYCTSLLDIYCYAEQVPYSSGSLFFGSNYGNATLHVPTTSIDAYSNSDNWKRLGSIVALTDSDPKPTGITNINNDSTTGKRYYSLDGKQITTPQRGINIIRMKDGTTKKVMVK